MGGMIGSLLAGGGIKGAGEGIASVIDAIKGKNPGDAAKLSEIAAQTEQLRMKYAAEFDQAQTGLVSSQIQVNEAEATNQSIFVSGWRPFVGWVCGSGLAVQFILSPMVTWGAALAHHPVVFPSLDLGTLMTLLFGLLGLGGMRTYEKVNGVNAGH